MFSKEPQYVQDPPSYVFLGVNMQIHLSAAQTGGEFSMISVTMPPGGEGGLHVHEEFGIKILVPAEPPVRT